MTLDTITTRLAALQRNLTILKWMTGSSLALTLLVLLLRLR
jgi:hypothetical protein